jgi:hypothetical protein
MPWILNQARPASAEAISHWQIDPSGLWVRALGHEGQDSEHLKSQVLSILNQPLTQEFLGKAIQAMNDAQKIDALYPARAIGAIVDNGQIQPTLDELQTIYKKLMEPDRLAILELIPE